MLHSRGRTGAQGGAVQWGALGSADRPSNTALSSGSMSARGDLVCAPVFNEPFQRHHGGLEVM